MIDLSKLSPAAKQGLLAEAARRAAQNLTVRKKTVEWSEFRGANLTVQKCHDDEVVLVGAAGTGKTYANLVKINRLCWHYPGLRVLMLRKVRADLAQSVLVTWERDVLGYENPMCQGATREHRQTYQYPNGSLVALAGMDRPGKVLSSEWDIIYVSEVTQLEEHDWEMLGMRLARGSDFPYPQLLGDTNPDRPDHWLKRRMDFGQTTGLVSFHHDNPMFYAGGEWTPKGAAYLRRLEKLTGVRKARYLKGLWVIADGAIYEDWNEAIHLIDPFDIPANWRRYRVIDFGFTNPFVCQWWALDPDGRMYLYREIYRTKRLVQDHAEDIKRLSAEERIELTIADHDAEDRATLHRHGVQTVAAKKEVLSGIQAVQERLKAQEDGKPRLFIFRGALVEPDPELMDSESGDKRPASTAAEIGGYVWSNKTTKEAPLKEDDHGMDAMRYMAMHLVRRNTWRAKTA